MHGEVGKGPGAQQKRNSDPGGEHPCESPEGITRRARKNAAPTDSLDVYWAQKSYNF